MRDRSEMQKYKIVGSKPVAGHAPGDTISETDLAGASIEVLVEAGHIVPIASAPSKKQDPIEEEK